MLWPEFPAASQRKWSVGLWRISCILAASFHHTSERSIAQSVNYMQNGDKWLPKWQSVFTDNFLKVFFFSFFFIGSYLMCLNECVHTLAQPWWNLYVIWCVCVHECDSVCVCVCVCACLCVWLCACMNVTLCLCVCVRARERIRVCTCMCVCVPNALSWPLYTFISAVIQFKVNHLLPRQIT